MENYYDNCHLFKCCNKNEFKKIKFDKIKDYSGLNSPGTCKRTLVKCPVCKALFLNQILEYNINDKDEYFSDYIQVSSVEEADLLNSKLTWNNFKIHSNNMIMIDNKKYYFLRKKIGLNNLLSQVCTSYDAFWKVLVNNNIEKDFCDSKDIARDLIEEISNDQDIFNEYCNALVKNSLELNDNIYIGNISAKNIYDSNTKLKFLEVYHFLYSLKNYSPLVSFYEYNVNPDPKFKNIFCISIFNDFINYNGNIITNKGIVKEVLNIISNYKNDILTVMKLDNTNYKGGRQKMFSIDGSIINFEDINLFGNTNNSQIKELYDRIILNIKNILKNLISN